MNYTLKDLTKEEKKDNAFALAAKELLPLLFTEKRSLFFATLAVLVNSGLTLGAPILIAHTIDTYIVNKEFSGVLLFSGIIVLMYIGAFFFNSIQIRLMGTLGQRTLFRLRNQIFNKIGSLPIAFFNQNKAGDLISRINNDTEKLNQFFSQSLVQLAGSLVTMIGAGIVMLAINWRLGVAALIPALFLVLFTRTAGPWVRKTNTANLQAVGSMSAEVQESLDNFKVVAAFNRRDYFRERFEKQNKENFGAAFRAGMANSIFEPAYTFFSNLAEIVVLSFGIYLIIQGHLTIGFLISFLAYVGNFYNPLRQIAGIYTTLQTALAAWGRVTQILSLESNLTIIKRKKVSNKKNATFPLLQFKNVSFSYEDGEEILHDLSFSLERGKIYALVGPTGGGKTTTASLMARLYDRTNGEILFEGEDIRTLPAKDRSKKIGFILQDPFIMSGTVRENILYGNEELAHVGTKELEKMLHQKGFEKILSRFTEGLDTKISGNQSGLSLGQKQLVAFIRAVLREPKLLILDEATANVDTVTESLLSEILEGLPKDTALVTIAHRLNTIENADQIFFVNSGVVSLAGSFDHALQLLLSDKRKS